MRRPLLLLIEGVPLTEAEKEAGPQDVSLSGGDRQGRQRPQAPPASHTNQVTSAAELNLQWLWNPPPALGSTVTFGCVQGEFLEYWEQVLSCPPEAPGTWGT